MNEQFITLLIVLVSILSVLSVIGLCFVIAFFYTLSKTLLRIQKAVTTVEDTAVRSLAPFLSLKTFFSDTSGFLSAIRSITAALTAKKSRK